MGAIFRASSSSPLGVYGQLHNLGAHISFMLLVPDIETRHKEVTSLYNTWNSVKCIVTVALSVSWPKFILGCHQGTMPL
jgi:hypothetical protein